MSRWQSTLYDRIIERHGIKFVKLETGRLVHFSDALHESEGGLNKLWRWGARVNKLANNEYDLERYENLIDDVERFVIAHREEIEKRTGNLKIEEQIKKLEAVAADKNAYEGDRESALGRIEALRQKQLSKESA